MSKAAELIEKYKIEEVTSTDSVLKTVNVQKKKVQGVINTLLKADPELKFGNNTDNLNALSSSIESMERSEREVIAILQEAVEDSQSILKWMNIKKK